jgi:hypothetical protein
MCDAGANGFMHKRPFGVCLLQSATLALVQSSMHLDTIPCPDVMGLIPVEGVDGV